MEFLCVPIIAFYWNSVFSFLVPRLPFGMSTYVLLIVLVAFATYLVSAAIFSWYLLGPPSFSLLKSIKTDASSTSSISNDVSNNGPPIHDILPGHLYTSLSRKLDNNDLAPLSGTPFKVFSSFLLMNSLIKYSASFTVCSRSSWSLSSAEVLLSSSRTYSCFSKLSPESSLPISD